MPVRALHHYGQLGLLAPTARSQGGYRLYSPADFQRLRLILFYRAETDREFSAAMAAGGPASGPRAMAAAERHLRHISQWFYDCGYRAHCGLAEMYLADERFTRHCDALAAGLGRYVHDAIIANAGRAAG